jgi:hypothetical protein
MPRQKKTRPENPQPPLIKLSEEEVLDHQRNLPKLVGALEDMKTVHAGRRTEMKTERSELQQRINNIAQQLRDSGR